MSHFAVQEDTQPRPARIAPGSFQPPILPPEVFDPSLATGVHGWADNTNDVTRGIGDEFLAFVTVTPRTSGLFRVIGGAVLQLAIASPGPPNIDIQSFRLKVGHGDAPTIDYATATPINVVAQTQAGNASSGFGAIFYETTNALPLDVPVKIGIVLAGGNGNLFCPAHSAQVVVQEL